MKTYSVCEMKTSKSNETQTKDGAWYDEHGLEIKQKKDVRMIDANNAISVLKILSDKCGNDNAFEQAISVLKSVPTIRFNFITEQPEIIRCKDCKHRKQPTDYCEKLLKAYVPDDFYCFYGERKEN